MNRKYQSALGKIRFSILAAVALSSLTAAIPVHAQESTATPETTESNCSDGQLRVGDLQLMDAGWGGTQSKLQEIAVAWESDAMLTGLRVSCDILAVGFRWQGTYYSPGSQTFFETDTGSTIGAEFNPDDALPLPSEISFGSVWRTLAKAGYSDDTRLNPATAIVFQMNAPGVPFGPAEVPDGSLVCHVALDYLGETRDLFITVPDGMIYRHVFP